MTLMGKCCDHSSYTMYNLKQALKVMLFMSTILIYLVKKISHVDSEKNQKGISFKIQHTAKCLSAL